MKRLCVTLLSNFHSKLTNGSKGRDLLFDKLFGGDWIGNIVLLNSNPCLSTNATLIPPQSLERSTCL